MCGCVDVCGVGSVCRWHSEKRLANADSKQKRMNTFFFCSASLNENLAFVNVYPLCTATDRVCSSWCSILRFELKSATRTWLAKKARVVVVVLSCAYCLFAVSLWMHPEYYVQSQNETYTENRTSCHRPIKLFCKQRHRLTNSYSWRHNDRAVRWRAVCSAARIYFDIRNEKKK